TPQLEDPELASLPGAVPGRVLFMQGRFREALQMLNEAVPLLAREKNHHEPLFVYVTRAMAQRCLSHDAAARSGLNHTLRAARSNRAQNAEVVAHTALAFAEVLAGEYREAIATAGEALAVAENSGDTYYRYACNNFIAWGKFGLGRAAESLSCWA